MNYDVFYTLAERTKQIMGEDKCGTHAFVDDLIKLSRRHHAQGLSTYHLANILFESSLGAMILMESMDENLIFAKFVQDAGDRSQKILAENWPPPDRNKWPHA